MVGLYIGCGLNGGPSALGGGTIDWNCCGEYICGGGGCASTFVAAGVGTYAADVGGGGGCDVAGGLVNVSSSDISAVGTEANSCEMLAAAAADGTNADDARSTALANEAGNGWGGGIVLVAGAGGATVLCTPTMDGSSCGAVVLVVVDVSD